MSDDYVNKRNELLAKCKSSNELDVNLLIQCDCLNLLDTQSRAFDAYTQSLANYNSDMAKWVEFNHTYGHIISQYQQYEKDLNDYEHVIDYSGIALPQLKECKAYGDYFEASRDTTAGGIGGGTLHCKWTPSYKKSKLVKWRSEHNLPDGVYYPPTVAPFNPGSVMCCAESMKNISNTGTIEFNNIKQNCLLEIKQNIDFGNTLPPTSPPSMSSTPYPDDQSDLLQPTYASSAQPPDNTLWIVIGVIGGVFLLLVGIGIYRRYGSDENTNDSKNSSGDTDDNKIDS